MSQIATNQCKHGKPKNMRTNQNIKCEREMAATEKKTIKQSPKTGIIANCKRFGRKARACWLEAAECECDWADKSEAAERAVENMYLALEREKAGNGSAVPGSEEAANKMEVA